MQITLKLSKDFETCLDDLKAKYGEAFEYINGLHESQLDFSEFIENFVSKNTLADASIDPNANANNRDIRAFMTEKAKAEDKLFGLNKIFSAIKKQWGLRTAREWLEQEYSRGFYLNDSTTASYFPYCYAVDFTRLATEGLFFLNNYNNKPPKHLTTYLDDVIEFVSFLSNRQSGAVGMPNVIVWAWYFWKKDCEDGYYMKNPEYYMRQQFQKLIFRLNQPFLRIDQTSFTNVSIFDHPYLEALFGGIVFPDGTLAIDHIEDIIECEKVFMDVVSETRKVNMFTYPVLTFSLLYKDGHFVDEEFARYASSHNIEWSDSNFFVSDNVGVLSNCPVSGDTPLLYWNEYKSAFDVATMEEIYDRKAQGVSSTITVLSRGKPVRASIHRYDEPITFEIQLENGVKLKTTKNHLNRVYGIPRDKKTEELTTEDYLPFSAVPYESDEEKNPVASFNFNAQDGRAVGINALYSENLDLRCLNEPLKSRQGIMTGFRAASHGDSQYPITVTSKKLATQITALISANGWLPLIDEVQTKDGPVFNIGCSKNRRALNHDFFYEDGLFWVKVKSVHRITEDIPRSYCLTVLDDVDPIYMLANGLHTHNCRLLSDTKKLDAFINSIGGTALSVGSCRVSTINLVRIAYESGFDKERYIELLKERVLLDCKALTSMRHILKRNIEKGLLPNYQDGALEMDKQFSTIGGIGVFEVMDLFGLIHTDELGCKSYSNEAVAFATRILDVMNEVKDNFPCDFSFNIEMIPKHMWGLAA